MKKEIILFWIYAALFTFLLGKAYGSYQTLGITDQYLYEFAKLYLAAGIASVALVISLPGKVKSRNIQLKRET